jgi:hypothetical protein
MVDVPEKNQRQLNISIELGFSGLLRQDKKLVLRRSPTAKSAAT